VRQQTISEKVCEHYHWKTTF